MNFREYINESIKQNKVDKVIVKGLERYIVQGSENGKPYVITSSGEKRVGNKYFENLKDEDYFKTEKEAEKYLNESIFKKDKRMNQDEYTKKLVISGNKTFELRFFESKDNIVVSVEDYRKLPLSLKGMHTKSGFNIFKNEKSLISTIKKRDSSFEYKIEEI